MRRDLKSWQIKPAKDFLNREEICFGLGPGVPDNIFQVLMGVGRKKIASAKVFWDMFHRFWYGLVQASQRNILGHV